MNWERVECGSMVSMGERDGAMAVERRSCGGGAKRLKTKFGLTI